MRGLLKLVIGGAVLVGVIAVTSTGGAAAPAGEPPSLGASHRPTTSLGTRAKCLSRGEAGLRSANFRIERFQTFVRGKADDVAVLIHCVAEGGSVHLDVIVAGSPGFAAKANDVRLCLTAYMLGTKSSCGAGPATASGGSGWSATATGFRGRNGERFSFACEPKGTLARSVWGTGVYTDDSSVCAAGVHAGLITFARGGTVVIEIRPGRSSYTGSTRNGVSSKSYGSWGGSFVLVR